MQSTKASTNHTDTDSTTAVAHKGVVEQSDIREIQDFEKSKAFIPVQTKLQVGAPDDPLEKEADQMAEKVMRMPAPAIQRKNMETDEEEQLQMKPDAPRISRFSSSPSQSQHTPEVSSALGSKISGARGQGQMLSSGTRSFMESRFGADFSNVSIHTGSEATSMNRELQAKAFTVGNDIFFNQGQYKPSSSEGKRLLAHELTHTIQQGGSQEQVQREDWGASYRAWKDAKYEAMIAGGTYLKNAAFDAMRDEINELPVEMRAPCLELLDIFEGVVDILISFVYAVIGLIVGIIEGIVAIIHGLIKLVMGVVKYLLLLLKAFIGYPNEFITYHNEIVAAVKGFPAAFKQMLAQWFEKFQQASPKRQTIMIGELTGQILTFIGTFGLAAGKAGKIPPASIPVPVATPLAHSGELVITFVPGRAVAVGEPLVAMGGPGMAMAMTGSGGGGNNGGGNNSGGNNSGSGQGSPQQPGKHPNSTKTQQEIDDMVRQRKRETRSQHKKKELGALTEAGPADDFDRLLFDESMRITNEARLSGQEARFAEVSEVAVINNGRRTSIKITEGKPVPPGERAQVKVPPVDEIKAALRNEQLADDANVIITHTHPEYESLVSQATAQSYGKRPIASPADLRVFERYAQEFPNIEFRITDGVRTSVYKPSVMDELTEFLKKFEEGGPLE